MSPVALAHDVQGPAEAPGVLLGPSIGTTMTMWAAQAEALRDQWRVVRFDTRGHGRSPVVAGPASVADLAGDVLSLADALELERFAYCGLSLGGAVGQWLAARHPDRVSALVLACTAARFGDAASWAERAARVRAEGMEWMAAPSRQRWFTPGFADRDPDVVRRLLAELVQIPAEGYAACCEALGGFDGSDLLGRITAPTLVIAGSDDPATPPDVCRDLVRGIGGAEWCEIPDAAHLAAVERPGAVAVPIQRHLRRHAR